MIRPDDMFTLNNQLMLNYKKHLDIWDTNGKINPDQYARIKTYRATYEYEFSYRLRDKQNGMQTRIAEPNESVRSSVDE